MAAGTFSMKEQRARTVIRAFFLLFFYMNPLFCHPSLYVSLSLSLPPPLILSLSLSLSLSVLFCPNLILSLFSFSFSDEAN